jgi:hypothetical protein
MKTVTSLNVVESKLQPIVDSALDASGGLLRLAPCWVPRSFLQPGRRLKLHPDDLYAYGRETPRALLVKDIPPDRHDDLDFIVSELDWEANVDPNAGSADKCASVWLS